jgi:hypothetical protein
VQGVQQHLSEWDTDESALAVVVLTVWFTPGKLDRRGAVLERPKIETLETVRASLSLHCIARSFERLHPKPDDAAIVHAASSLAQPSRPEEVCAPDGNFRIPAAGYEDDAFWLGALANDSQGHRYLSVQTLSVRG